MKKNLKSWLPQIVIILVLNFIYFYPALEGKILNQSDILMGKIKSKELVDYRAEHGEEPLWRTHIFSGMPELFVFNNSMFTKTSHLLKTVFGGPGVHIIAILMLGVFLWFRSSKVDPWLSLIGSIAIGFSAFFIISIGAGHSAKIATAAYIAPILMSILITYRGKVLLGMVLTALFVGQSVFSNHIQISYYTTFIILCLMTTYGIYAYKKKEFSTFLKRSALLAVAALIGIGPNFGRLWTNYVNMQETMRGGGSELALKENTNQDGLDYDYAMSWSYGIAETSNLIFPYSMGGGTEGDYSSTDLYDEIYRRVRSQGSNDEQARNAANQFVGQSIYWGDQSLVNGAYYMGAVIFFLFIFGLLTVKGKNKYWIVAALIGSLILAWGKNLETISHILFDHLPLYDKFRVPSMALVIVFILVPYLSFIGLNQFFNGDESRAHYKKKLIRAIGISVGASILFWILGTSMFSFEGLRDDIFRQQYSQYGINFQTVIGDRKSLFTASIFRSILMMAIVFGLLWFYNSGSLKKPAFLVLIGGLIMFDLWSFDKDQVNKDDFISGQTFEQSVIASQADLTILEDPDIHFRVFNTTRPLTGDYQTAYFHKSLGGIHATKLQRYQDLIDFQLSKGNLPSINMLNTKWLIVSDQDQGNPIAQRNPDALGNAWFVNKIIWAENANSEMNIISEFDAGNEVVVGEEFRDYMPKQNLNNSGSSIRLTQFDNKEMIYEANVSGGEQFAVFSEIYYKPKYQAWQAYIDGEKVDHIKVNYLLRGLKIPEGKHEIVFRFEPTTYFVGETIDLIFSIILILGVLFVSFKEFFTKKKAEANAAEPVEA